MFRKCHKIKSNTKLRSSERKKFLTKVLENFKLNDDNISSLFPSKETVTNLKIISHSSDLISIYICQGTPLFFEHEENIYPTIFLLWQIPNLTPYIKVHSGVVPKLSNGADLMIPGIVTQQDHLRENNYPPYTLAYINTENNMAAVGVGVTLVNSSEMVIPGCKGKAVQLLHVVGDELFKIDEAHKEIPVLEFSSGKIQSETCEEKLVKAANEIHLSESAECDSETPKESEQPMTMDDLLLYSFIKGVKRSTSVLTLPILTNIFYKNFVIESVPKNMILDLKKTKYKKLSAFLAEMSEKGIISLETTKGVQSIVFINYEHEIFHNFDDKYKDEDVCKNEEQSKTVEIIEKKIINGAVDKIFIKSNYRKGDCLTEQQIRKCVTEYVKNEGLQDINAQDTICLNGVLCDILQTKDTHIIWKDLFESIYKKMGNSYEIRLPNNQVILGKGKLLPIELKVVVKTSNKKVTLVNNLELYGININEFSKECQHGVAASCTINTLPNNKSNQFQIQGNQKKFIGQVLLEKYCIPKKYIQGLEEQKSKKS